MTGHLPPSSDCLPRRSAMLGGHLVSLVIYRVLALYFFCVYICFLVVTEMVTFDNIAVALLCFMFIFGGHLTGCCACVSPGEILHILPKLATMSAHCSWYVHCLGQVIWWLDRNRQDLLTESVNKYILCVLK